MEHSEVGKYTAISGDILGSSYSQIRHTKIGNYCSIGPNFVTLPYGHNYNNISTYLFKRNDKSEIFNEIIIDNDVWIGSNVIILGGVKIANGSVIGAGSVVTKDTQPYSIYVGNPAKLLKYRFHKKKINELLKSAWWNKTKDPYE